LAERNNKVESDTHTCISLSLLDSSEASSAPNVVQQADRRAQPLFGRKMDKINREIKFLGRTIQTQYFQQVSYIYSLTLLPNVQFIMTPEFTTPNPQ